MLQAMFNGVSGVQAHKTQLDVIGNNVANVNTVAFKASRTVFKDVISQTIRSATQPTESGLGGTNPFQVGLGVQAGAADLILTQGSMQPTGKITDVAIEGNGFLMATDGVQKFYTRDGSFYLDSAGYLVCTGSGMHVLGWSANPLTGQIDTTETITENATIRILVGQTSIAQATSTVEMGGNLDGAAAYGSNWVTGFDVYDSHGIAHRLNLNFIKSQTIPGQQATWMWYATSPSAAGSGSARVTPAAAFTPPTASTTLTLNHVTLTVDPTDTAASMVNKINNAGAGVTATLTGTDRISLASVATGSSVNISMTAGPGYSLNDIFGAGYVAAAGTGPTMGSGTITFDEQGNSNSSGSNINITLAKPDGVVNPINIRLDFSTLKQLAGSNTVSAQRQDGLSLGTLESFSIGKDGIITGRYTNGISKSLAQLAMADFRNSAGLAKAGSNLWIETSNSGLAQIGEPSKGSRGRITAGFLESSNVDLPTEFTNMIVAQRGFQANARIITTSDEVLQELVQLKR